MQRFVLSENIRNFRRRLAEAADEPARQWLAGMIVAAEREMALLDATRAGALPPWRKSPPRDLEAAQAKAVAWFVEAHATSPNPAAVIDPSPGLALVAVNGAFEQAASLSRDRIIGRPLFDLFPDNPNDPSADGVHNLYASLRMVADTGRAHQMALQRYDTQDTSGVWNARYWRPVNTPLNDDDGALILLLHVVEEATGEAAAGAPD